MQRKYKTIISLTLIVFLLALSVPVAAQTQAFTKLVTRTLLVLGTSEFRDDITAGGDLVVTGGVSAATLTASGADSVGTFRQDGKAANVTVTTDGTITPLGSYQPITSAGNVQTSAIAGCATGTTGETVELINVGSNTITISDTGTLKLTGNIALGVTDVLALRCDGTNWIERYASNN